jgi:hypothetical protein
MSKAMGEHCSYGKIGGHLTAHRFCESASHDRIFRPVGFFPDGQAPFDILGDLCGSSPRAQSEIFSFDLAQ